MENKTHKLSMNNRRNLVLTGIVDVISFDTAQVLLESTCGIITIKGKDLKVGKIALETGEVDVSGEVSAFSYSDSLDLAKKGKSLAKRLFK